MEVTDCCAFAGLPPLLSPMLGQPLLSKTHLQRASPLLSSVLSLSFQVGIPGSSLDSIPQQALNVLKACC